MLVSVAYVLTFACVNRRNAKCHLGMTVNRSNGTSWLLMTSNVSPCLPLLSPIHHALQISNLKLTNVTEGRNEREKTGERRTGKEAGAIARRSRYKEDMVGSPLLHRTQVGDTTGTCY